MKFTLRWGRLYGQVDEAADRFDQLDERYCLWAKAEKGSLFRKRDDTPNRLLFEWSVGPTAIFSTPAAAGQKTWTISLNRVRRDGPDP